jgi:multicomponent Na+:H+ antiporter subunit D
MGNLSKWMPALTALFLFQAMSLTGLPPLSGFWGKYLLILESIRLEHYLLAAIALATSWLTLFSMVKIWVGAFWKEPEIKPVFLDGSRQVAAYGPIVLLVAASLILGLGVEYFYVKAESAAEQIFAAAPYVETVLGGDGKGEL